MNACTFCKNGKRKCDKARPSCSNCLRLGRNCVYSEDAIQTYFVANSQPTLEQLPHPHSTHPLPGIDPFSRESLQQSTVDTAMRILGSLDNIRAISADFFTETHQRIPALSKFRFYKNIEALSTGPPRADFALLCLCILLIQQMPSKVTSLQQPSLYITVKSLISSLEVTNNLSLDFAHCRILVVFYEMGHGLHTAAYISLAACARTARALGLHRKRWRNVDAEADKLVLEEEKRTWWAIVILDRFISLCNGDALFVTDDPERSDSLPIEDLLWSEGSTPEDLEGSITAPPSLETPFNITVGQMARESQIAHLVGRVVQHVFNPTRDPDFNTEEATQLERTLKAYLPLLRKEELRIGKYCAAFGMCNSSLFILYEYMLSQGNVSEDENRRILQAMQETSLQATTFAEASYMEREQNYPFEILSPYLPYSLCQAAIVQYRVWKYTNDPSCKRNFDVHKDILREFTKRWMVAKEYLEIIDNLDGDWPSLAFPFQGSFISTGKSKA